MILDISIGLLLGIIVNFFASGESIVLIISGGLFAIILDTDFIIYFLKNNWKIDEFAHEHRDFFHNPIILSLLVGIVFFVILGWSWGLLWMLATFYHCFHDTVENGWGIRWLYPFCSWYFTLVSYSPKRIIKTRDEQRRIAAKHGDPNWLREELKIKPRLIFEVLFLAIILIKIWYIA